MAVVINGTSGITNPNGSAGAPSLVGQGSTTGVYFPSNTSVGLATAGLGRVIADANGYVTQPYQPAFFAKKTDGTGATIQGTLAEIPLNATDFNIGNCYNTSTYRFTAPVTGSYYFAWIANTATTTWDNPTPAGNTLSMALYKNGTWINATTTFTSCTNSGQRIPSGGSAVLYLTANDYVSVGIPESGGQIGDGNGSSSQRLSFSGYFIG